MFPEFKKEVWNGKSKEFSELWNFPNCVVVRDKAFTVCSVFTLKSNLIRTYPGKSIKKS